VHSPMPSPQPIVPVSLPPPTSSFWPVLSPSAIVRLAIPPELDPSPSAVASSLHPLAHASPSANKNGHSLEDRTIVRWYQRRLAAWMLNGASIERSAAMCREVVPAWLIW
jgi:hypothetical protein